MQVGAMLLLAGVVAAQRPARSHDARAFLPLAPGTTWVYAVEHPAAPAGVTVTKRITRVLTIDGEPCVELAVETSDTELDLPTREYLVAGRSGISSHPGVRGAGGTWLDPQEPPELWLACPAGPIADWTVRERNRTGTKPRQTARLEAVGTSLRTAAGEFSTTWVRIDSAPGDEDIRRLAFARGAGIVHDATERAGQPRFTYRLQSFQSGTRPPAPDPLALVKARLPAESTLATIEHAWLQRSFESRFVRLGAGERARIARVWRGEVTLLDLGDPTQLARVLADECIEFCDPGDNRLLSQATCVPPLAGLALLELARTPAAALPPDLLPHVRAGVTVSGRVRAHSVRLDMPEIGMVQAAVTLAPGTRPLLSLVR